MAEFKCTYCAYCMLHPDPRSIPECPICGTVNPAYKELRNGVD